MHLFSHRPWMSHKVGATSGLLGRPLSDSSLGDGSLCILYRSRNVMAFGGGDSDHLAIVAHGMAVLSACKTHEGHFQGVLEASRKATLS